jgi:hypothetical protein
MVAFVRMVLSTSVRSSATNIRKVPIRVHIARAGVVPKRHRSGGQGDEWFMPNRETLMSAGVDRWGSRHRSPSESDAKLAYSGYVRDATCARSGRASWRPGFPGRRPVCLPKGRLRSRHPGRPLLEIDAPLLVSVMQVSLVDRTRVHVETTHMSSLVWHDRGRRKAKTVGPRNVRRATTADVFGRSGGFI